MGASWRDGEALGCVGEGLQALMVCSQLVSWAHVSSGVGDFVSALDH